MYCGRMSLINLPNEMIAEITSHLDANSLAAFAEADKRLHEVTRYATNSIRTESLSESLLNYIRSSGISLTSLNLSNCPVSEDQLLSVVLQCRYLTELNVANTRLSWPDLWDVLDRLARLETLTFSMLKLSWNQGSAFSTKLQCHPQSRRPYYPSIKSLYIESSANVEAAMIIFHLLERCVSIERLHVYFMGMSSDEYVSYFPYLSLSQHAWRTLRTVVVSISMSDCQGFHRNFLRRIFDNISNERIAAWINQDRESYIYEKGWLNDGKRTSNSSFKPKVELLDRISHAQPADLQTLEDFRTPWGFPQSLRLNLSKSKLFVSQIFKSFERRLPDLVELDLADLHGVNSMAVRLNFFNAARTLEALAAPICFIRHAPQDIASESEVSSTSGALEQFSQVFRRLQLKKLHIMEYPRTSPLGGLVGYCQKCENALSSTDLPRMNDLRNLEELTFKGIRVMSSAYKNMANSRAHTIRLTLRLGSEIEGLGDFITASSNLQRFKLAGYFNSVNSPEICNALVASRKLKHLCLDMDFLTNRSTTGFQGALSLIIHRLEVLHLHYPSTYIPHFELLSPALIVDFKGALVGPQCGTMDRVKKMTFRENCLPGRSLCNSETFIGRVKPMGWS